MCCSPPQRDKASQQLRLWRPGPDPGRKSSVTIWQCYHPCYISLKSQVPCGSSTRVLAAPLGPSSNSLRLKCWVSSGPGAGTAAPPAQVWRLLQDGAPGPPGAGANGASAPLCQISSFLGVGHLVCSGTKSTQMLHQPGCSFYFVPGTWSPRAGLHVSRGPGVMAIPLGLGSKWLGKGGG